MIYFVIFSLIVSMIVIFCSRHFLSHLLGLKLFIDCTLLLLARTRTMDGDGPHFEASAWMFAALGSLLFFALIVMATRKFAAQSDLKIESHHE